ncbi:MAG TPA: alpha/beta hydrolase [Gemmatimonadales bacterium]|nr:alpha/beta hydrolase [Gemmatimonadales bacterium]
MRRSLLIVLLITLGTACSGKKQAEPNAAATTATPGTGFVTLPSGGRLYYEVAGGSGDTIVVPGAAYWSSPLAPLAQHHTVIFYDLLGRGRSDTAGPARIVMDSIVSDLEALRQHFNAQRIGLVGVSVSSLVAAGYAARYPDRVSRLALVNPIALTAGAQTSYRPPERASRTDSAAFKEVMQLRATNGSREAICRQAWKANSGWFVGDASASARIDPTWCAAPNETVDATLMWLGYLSNAAGSWDITAKVRSIKAPTLVVQAERDYFVNPAGAKAWASAIPGAKLVSLPGVGHFVLYEKPDAALAPLQEFFSGR